MGLTGQAVYTAVEVALGVSCVLGNALTIGALVWSTKRSREPQPSGTITTTSTVHSLLSSLAVADMLVGGLAIPLAVGVVDGRLEMSSRACLLASCLLILPTLASVMSLLAIAVDRYLRVYAPLRYRRSVMKRHSWLAVALCWAVAIIMSFTPILGWNDQPAANSSSSSVFLCRFTAVISKSYLVYFTFFLCNLLPLSTMALLYCGIFCAIRRRLRRDEQRGSRVPAAAPDSRGYLKRERRLAASLALVLALFALSWLPLHVINCVEYFGGGGGAAVVPVAAVYVAILLSHANSAVNPVVYAFRIPKIKRGYLRMWSRVVAWRGSSQPPSSQSLDNVVSSDEQLDTC